MLSFCRITCLILCVCFLKIEVLSSGEWDEEENALSDPEDENFPQRTECPDKFEGLCNKEYSKAYSLYDMFFKNKHGTPKLKDKRTPASALYDTINRVPCQCEMSDRLMDLGIDRYPRYIQTGVCKKRTCGAFHRCISKKYKIRLLKRRDPDVDTPGNSIDLSEPHLPESLAENWISDYVNIIISCECVPIKI